MVVLCPRCREAFDSPELLNLHICPLAPKRPFTLRESVLLALATGEDLTAAVIRVRAEKYWRDLGMGAVVTQLEMLVREGHVRRRGQPAMYSIILPGAER